VGRLCSGRLDGTPLLMQYDQRQGRLTEELWPRPWWLSTVTSHLPSKPRKARNACVLPSCMWCQPVCAAYVLCYAVRICNQSLLQADLQSPPAALVSVRVTRSRCLAGECRRSNGAMAMGLLSHLHTLIKGVYQVINPSSPWCLGLQRGWAGYRIRSSDCGGCIAGTAAQ
jgi:hypothetical protein